jgi:DNA (cytosine-5)-methyltransferase 1
MHLFAGAGGGLLADLILGHTPVVAVEWDAYCCQVLRERAEEGWFPGLQVWEGDVGLFDPSDWAGRVDCIHAGFPCQDISVAGKQAGVGEGTRSGLYREVLRIADVVRPGYLFLENVAAILGNGLGTVLGDLASRGYDCRWDCIRAADVGAPHLRDRWWMVADSSSFDRDEVGSKGRLPLESKRTCDDSAVSIPEWFVDQPEMGCLDDGVPNRVDQLRVYGNAQVPLQAALAWRILTA